MWCYFAIDESDLIHHLRYAYTIWGKNGDIKQLYFKENRNACVENGIYIFQNTSYAMLKNARTVYFKK